MAGKNYKVKIKYNNKMSLEVNYNGNGFRNGFIDYGLCIVVNYSSQ